MEVIFNMADLIKLKKGPQANLPNLNLAEPAFTTDEERLYIGGLNGNVPLPNKQDITTINSQLAKNTQDLSNTKAKINSEINSLIYPVYEPILPSNEWRTEEASHGKTLNINTSQFLALFYDDYVGTHADGYTVTKTSRGKDESGLYDIYEYDFKPKNYKKTIMLSSGLHPYELPASFGLAHFIKDVMTEPYINESFKYIKENVRIKIIPVLNPWGFNQSPKTYGNVNGVNPNRNFDYNGAWKAFPVHSANPSDPNYNEWNVKGSAPWSEAETRIMRDWAIENADVAEFWIDCHTGRGNAHVDNWVVGVSNDPIIPKVYSAIEKLEERIKIKYNRTPTRKVDLDNPNSIKHKYVYNELGLSIITVELSNYWGTAVNNDAEDIQEYETALSAYVFEFLNVPFIGTIKKYVSQKIDNIGNDVEVAHTTNFINQAYPNIVDSDTFERPDSTTIGVTEMKGKTWVTSGDWAIQNNKLVLNQDTSTAIAFFNAECNNFYFETELTYADGLAGVVFRVKNYLDYLQIAFNKTYIRFAHMFNGNAIFRITRDIIPVIGQQYKLGVYAKDNKIMIFLDGRIIINTDYAGNANETRVGVRTNKINNSFDNILLKTDNSKITITTLENGWTGSLTLIKNGNFIGIHGDWTAGTVADNTIIVNIPTNFTPAVSHFIPTSVSGTNTVTMGLCLINSDRNLYLRKPLSTVIEPGDTIKFNSVYVAQ